MFPSVVEEQLYEYHEVNSINNGIVVPQEVISKVLQFDLGEVGLEENFSEAEFEEEGKQALLDVPFIPQAPYGDWSDPRLQDGCEEAAIIMAMAWVRGERLSSEGVLEEIFALTRFQEEWIGHFYDTSAEDTAQLMRTYFDYTEVAITEGISVDDIKTELKKGNLVIVPINGRRLGNPFYTPPGPTTHMLVIRGYDNEKGEFITNDPGTKRGEEYRYKELLARALQDYPTGHDEPQISGKTAMIVVARDLFDN